ncbi:MAG: hypothetical protein MZV64_49510 [Ignavibacteriales bacterium]|nr:hypothetical protein [Ignavibacteriales bacterium]
MNVGTKAGVMAPSPGQAAEEVGDGVGDGESVGARAGAQVIGLEEVADVAQDPADQGRPGHGGRGADQPVSPVVAVHGIERPPGPGAV